MLDRMGLKVVSNRDGTVHIYQPPGDGNALGRVRFNFPNKFLVYQHDTPDKYLFANDKRAYSHGCMRVAGSAEICRGAAVDCGCRRRAIPPSASQRCTARRVNIQFQTPIPVHITYQTAFVDDDGRLQMRADIYG